MVHERIHGTIDPGGVWPAAVRAHGSQSPHRSVEAIGTGAQCHHGRQHFPRVPLIGAGPVAGRWLAAILPTHRTVSRKAARVHEDGIPRPDRDNAAPMTDLYSGDPLAAHSKIDEWAFREYGNLVAQRNLQHAALNGAAVAYRLAACQLVTSHERRQFQCLYLSL